MNEYDYIVYTDGACIGNPGAGGWAAIIRDRQGATRIVAGNAQRTTNNRMELTAAIESLRLLPEGVRVLLRTDSRHVSDGIEKGWAAKWKAQGWMRNRRERAENVDLWEQLLEETARRNVRIEWVRSHNGDPFNEQCDAIARQEAERATGTDVGYEQAQSRQHQLLHPSEPSTKSAGRIECRTRSDRTIEISDGTHRLTLEREHVPELIYQLTRLLTQ
jgi:ribonuclease HI